MTAYYPLLLPTGARGPETADERAAFDAGASGDTTFTTTSDRMAACFEAGATMAAGIDRERAWLRRNNG